MRSGKSRNLLRVACLVRVYEKDVVADAVNECFVFPRLQRRIFWLLSWISVYYEKKGTMAKGHGQRQWAKGTLAKWTLEFGRVLCERSRRAHAAHSLIEEEHRKSRERKREREETKGVNSLSLSLLL